jgi:carboxyl-terminal processing protease
MTRGVNISPVKTRVAIATSAAIFMSGCNSLPTNSTVSDDEILRNLTEEISAHHISGVTDEDLQKQYKENVNSCMHAGEGQEHTLCVIDTLTKQLDDKWAKRIDSEIAIGAISYRTVGARFGKSEQGIEVIDIHPDGSLARAGFKVGDVITSFESSSAKNASIQQLWHTIHRKSQVAFSKNYVPRSLLVETEALDIEPVTCSHDSNGVLNIIIHEFKLGTAEKVENFVQQSCSSNKPVTGIVLDVRDNHGGLVHECTSTAGIFLPKNAYLLHRKGVSMDLKDYNDRKIGKQDKPSFTGVPLAVLINDGSASCSEILAGVLQDHQRANIIGTRSYGKGTIQDFIPIGNGYGSLKLTIAKFILPKGELIDGIGIEPDIYAENNKAQMDAVHKLFSL